MTMRYTEAQFFTLMAWALRDHAVIVSGAYKSRKTQQGVELTDEEKAQGKEPWRDLTEEEKLQDAIGTLTSRCHMLGECADHIYGLNATEDLEEDQTIPRDVYKEVGREFEAYLRKKR